MIQRCENNPSEAVKVEYDPYNPFQVCSMSLTPIYRGTAFVTCPFCKAVYKQEMHGQLCIICGLSSVGADATGLKNMA